MLFLSVARHAAIATAFATVAAAAEPVRPADGYPLTTCIVSGDKLTEMGGPVKFVYNGREIHFCCKDCIKDFKNNPQKFLAKLDAAIRERSANR